MATNGINIEQSNADLAKSRIHSWKKFGLRSSPFDNSFKCNYGSRIEHFQSNLNRLNSFCNAHENIAVVTGDPGVGKTLMFNDFMKEDTENFCKIEIEPDFGSVNILNAISSSLNLNLMVVGSSQDAYIYQIAHAILTQEAKFILVCDDAHKLDEPSFNTIIALLTNTKLVNHIKVILFGAQSIFERAVKYAVCKGSGMKLQHLIMQPLAEDQLKSYLHNCLAKSGWPGALPEIPPAVLHEIFTESEGIPRRVNIAAEQILLRELPAPPQQDTVEHTEVVKEYAESISKQSSSIRTAAYDWQNSATAIMVTFGFIVVIYSSCIWYSDMLSQQNAPKISKVKTTTLAHAKALPLPEQNNDHLLERINKSLENSKPNTPITTIVSAAKPQMHAPTVKPETSAPENNELIIKRSKKIKPKIENLSGYTIQLSGSSNLEALIAFKNEQKLDKEMYIYKTSRQNKPWYVLVYGSFITKQEATEALKQLQQKNNFTGLWVKSFLDIHLASSSYINTD